MNEYTIQASVSKFEFEVIKEIRKVNQIGWGGIILNWQSGHCVQCETKLGKDREYLLGLQK